jgi:ferric-dicitrate binding protein FerR (iron transport regulator)
VETSAGTVTVLGTQFKVKNRANYFEAVCYEGLVQVTSTGKTIKLSPAKMFRVINGAVASDENSTEKLPSWLSNESSFESVPFTEVLQEFERQYNVTITTKNVELNQLFTGRFVHSNLSLAIQSIAIPLNLTYEIDSSQKNVVLSREVK